MNKTYTTKIEVPEFVPLPVYRKRWKEVIAQTLKELGIIDDNFKGEIIIQINNGGVRNIKQSKFIE